MSSPESRQESVAATLHHVPTAGTATATNANVREPLPPSLRMFKNAARSLRYANGTDVGGRIGVMRAIELMPSVRQMKSDRELLALAATTSQKLESYRTGWGLSRVKARDRITALGLWRLLSRSVDNTRKIDGA